MTKLTNILAFLLAPAMAFATPDLPCSLGKYRLPNANQLAIDCVRTLSTIDGKADLFLVVNNSSVGNAIRTGSLHVEDFSWIVITFDQPLAGGTDYEVVLNGRASAKSTDPTSDFAPTFSLLHEAQRDAIAPQTNGFD